MIVYYTLNIISFEGLYILFGIFSVIGLLLLIGFDDTKHKEKGNEEFLEKVNK